LGVILNWFNAIRSATSKPSVYIMKMHRSRFPLLAARVTLGGCVTSQEKLNAKATIGRDQAQEKERKGRK